MPGGAVLSTSRLALNRRRQAPAAFCATMQGLAPSPPAAHSRFAVVVAFAMIYVVWGSTYLAIRFAIETLPPFLMAAVRFLTAGTVLYVWARVVGGAAKPGRAQ